MLYFMNDYSEGAHPDVLEALIKTNEEKLPGYGTDYYSEEAKKKICKWINRDADIFFISGGTQTNKIVIDALLSSYEGVIAVDTGHVSCHEAGAIENTGHKVMTLQNEEGKLSAKDVEEYVRCFYEDENHEHMVFPGMVYISYPTEFGTLYSKKELTELYDVCKHYRLPLYIDGARLGYGLCAGDLSIEELASLCDVFYIGGTKVGALCGEAIVFKEKAPKHFVTFIKQHGALLAKGRLLGVQFDALFTDQLYMHISKHAIDMAMIMKEELKKRDYRFAIDSPTNQQFIIVENDKLEDIKKHVMYSFWQRYDETHTIIRLATSWATTKEDVEKLFQYL